MITHGVSMALEIIALACAAVASTWLASRLCRKGHGISILIPFRCTDPNHPRMKNVEWLQRYWKAQLPGAEIIIGVDPDLHKTFSKSVAVNDAVSKATGDIFVIVDADGYISADAVLHCAKEIRQARKRGQKLWFVPYRQFYRLTEDASKLLLASDPAKPHQFTVPLPKEQMIQDTDPTVGHWYGAMIQIMPREAFETVGGWDPRFRGWGGEDHAAMRAMDTLYWPHKTLSTAVLHVWHPQIGPHGTAAMVHWKDRMWENQNDPGANDKLSGRYYAAQGRPTAMQKLVNEGIKGAPIVAAAKGNPLKRTSI